MAEYIDRAKVDYEFIRTRGGGDMITNLYERILDIPTADVIEHSKIDKVLKEMDDLASHKVRPISFDQSVAIDMCINIIKRNIGE